MTNQNRDRGLSDLLSTASSLLNSSQSSGHGAASSRPSSTFSGNPNPSTASHSPKPSRTEILASAHVVMNAAKAKLQKPSSSSSPSQPLDMGKLAGAAGTLIGAASSHGKLDEGKYGKYAQKAQAYLHTYEMKHSKPGGAAPYATAQGHGNNQGYSSYTSAPGSSPYGHGHSSYSSAPQPSPYNQDHSSATSYGQQPSTAYPPAGYPGAHQSYGHGHQHQNKPASSYPYVNNEAPLGYPPAGYPTSGGGFGYPRK